ncbi:hypothetical protein EON62_06425, partial [archaeon]
VFLEELLPMTRLDQLLDYMYDNVAHVEPCKIGSARSASPAFMCLYRLAMFAPAARDMMRVLNSRDSVYIRAVGFLLLRYAAAPEEVWTWFEPYLDDATPFQPSGEGKGRSMYVHAHAARALHVFPHTLVVIHSFAPPVCAWMCRSFGEWLRELLTEMRYFTTHLPRLPTLIARDISVRIALAAKDDERAARNAPFASRLAPGMKVRARYSEDGKMYDATLDRATGPNDSIHYKGRWMVTYTEFGNAEIRSLGQLDLTDVVGDAGAAARDRSASSAFRSSSQAARDGGRHRSRSPSYAHGRQREEYDRDRARADNTERSSAGCGDEEDMESLRERVLARERNKVVVG